MRRTLVFLTIATALTGCMKASAGSSATPDFSAHDLSGAATTVSAGANDYATAVDVPMDALDEDAPMLSSKRVMAEAAPAERDAGGRGVFGGARDRRERRKAAKQEQARGDAAAPPPVGAEQPTAGEPAIADDDPSPQGHGRQIIYTAAMHVSVFDLEESMRTVAELPERYGGYVHSLSAGHVVMRVPAKHLRTVMGSLGDLGVVESRSLSASDVTAEFTDLESRIKVLRETQAQLIELLAKARTVEEALRVRQSLDQITMELETALGRMRQLDNLIAFSTLTLTMVERGPHQPIPTSNDPFPWVDGLGVEATEWN